MGSASSSPAAALGEVLGRLREFQGKHKDCPDFVLYRDELGRLIRIVLDMFGALGCGKEAEQAALDVKGRLSKTSLNLDGVLGQLDEWEAKKRREPVPDASFGVRRAGLRLLVCAIYFDVFDVPHFEELVTDPRWDICGLTRVLVEELSEAVARPRDRK